MSKKKHSKKKSYTPWIVVIAIIIIVFAYMKMGGVEEAMDEEDNLQDAQDQMEDTQEQDMEESDMDADMNKEEDAQPLYPDLCYAEGGTPRAEAKGGCRDGETNVGEVVGFKTTYFCCVGQ